MLKWESLLVFGFQFSGKSGGEFVGFQFSGKVRKMLESGKMEVVSYKLQVTSNEWQVAIIAEAQRTRRGRKGRIGGSYEL
jgi:hypothetical protein